MIWFPSPIDPTCADGIAEPMSLMVSTLPSPVVSYPIASGLPSPLRSSGTPGFTSLGGGA